MTVAKAESACVLTSFVDSLGATITAPMLPHYAKYFNASDMQVGLVYSSFAFATFCALPVQGRLCKTLGARRTILFSLIGTAAGCFWQGMAGSFTSLLLSRVFSGIWASVSEACQIYMNQLNMQGYALRRTNSQEITRTTISLLTSRQLASVAGPAIGGILSSFAPELPVLVQGLASAVLFGFAFFTLTEVPCLEQQFGGPLLEDGEQDRIHVNANPGMGTTAERLVIAIFGIASMSGVIAWMSIQAMFPVHATRVFELKPSWVGLVFVVCGIVQIFATAKVSEFLMRSQLRMEGTAILGSLILVIGAVGIPIQIVQLSAVSMCVATFGFALFNIAVTSSYTSLLDEASNVTVVMVMSMTKKFGAIVGPVIAGRVTECDVRYPFALAALAALISALLLAASLGSIRHVQLMTAHRRRIG